MIRPLILGGERVALARMLPEDQPSFQQWLAQDADLRHLIDDPHSPTMEDQQRWFLRSQQPDRVIFSLVTVPQGILIGNGGLVDVDREGGAAQFRITIGDPTSRGKGYGTEATVLILRYAFDELGLTRVQLRVLLGNTPAVRLYEKVGFRRVGEEPASGDRGRKIVMEMRREEFHVRHRR